jgi:hypothetical protein
MPTQPTFALYVSSMEGHLVTRYGAGARGAPSYIGARREAGDPTQIVWDPELVVALTADEVARHRLEYERELDAKALRRRTEAEFIAQVERETAPAAPPPAAPSSPATPDTEAPSAHE